MLVSTAHICGKKQAEEPREPLLMALVISLPVMLWRSIIMFLMMGCWHPERMRSALSWLEKVGQLRLLDFV